MRCEASCINGCLKCCSETELVRRLDNAVRDLVVFQREHYILKSRYHRRPALYSHQVSALESVGVSVTVSPEMGKAVMGKFREAAEKQRSRATLYPKGGTSNAG